jgi:chromosome segregation ATPase
MDLKSLLDSVTSKQQLVSELKMKIKTQEQAITYLDKEILQQQEKEARLSVQSINLATENKKFDEKIPLAQHEVDVARTSCSAQQHSATFMVEKLKEATDQLEALRRSHAEAMDGLQHKCTTQLKLLESLRVPQKP